MITDELITFVVQGPIRSETPDCLLSIRRHFPEAKIIFSTWAGSDVSNLDCDEVVFSEDPGSFDIVLDGVVVAKENTNRQLLTTRAGLEKVVTPFCVKLRSDNTIKHRGCVDLYHKAQHFCRDPSYSITSSRIVVSSVNTIDPTIFLGYVYQLSDWFFFGKTEDLKKYWMQDLLVDDEFLTNQNAVETDLYRGGFNFGRFSAEQLLFIGFLKKYSPVSCGYYRDHSNDNVNETIKFIVNNFYTVEPSKIGLDFDKYSRFVKLNINSWVDVKSYLGFWSTTITEQRWRTLQKLAFDENLSFSESIYVKIKRCVSELLKLKSY